MCKSFIKFVVLMIVLVLCFSFVSCSDNSKEPASDNAHDFYIKINDEPVDKSYIGYFFSIAQRNMLEEAGWQTGSGGNATEDDINQYWKTTKIDGKEAVYAARDLAADNAVRQKIQYYKAIEEGITLSDEEKEGINSQLETTVANNGGEAEFAKALESMNTDLAAYSQIITENVYAQKLYDKYDSMDKFLLTDAELNEFATANADKFAPDEMYDAAKKQKYNDMITQWEKDFNIEINDSKMNEFDV